ncbi:anti-sigma factor [Anaeromyxobacter sp. Fw109-5]|uniref:anti-sigma factor family protein n=1 Tax=Anaeromyxobacter sp. (strain Fw109-5) TaxID=404589 RepID=UPI00031030A4|nr:zf-HC2 domain-containing protein [Anaeromyxobacter sp. Fw109-5]
MRSGPPDPLRCADFSERLSELIDGERDPAVLDRVRCHVAGCSACARLALELLVTVQALHELSNAGHPAWSPGRLH